MMININDTIKFTIRNTGVQSCGLPDKPRGYDNGFWEVVDGLKTETFFEEYELKVDEDDFHRWLNRDKSGDNNDWF
jgi:hypothetical protein